ncbi:DUF5954 family protein [Kitasatospora sp. NPDC050543]|uniref:DUF5954 family protein n=1 Tax=Kitasatospora sp. NPDC050543 TaxID=3364054 RepID=UPI003794CB01
MEADDSAVKRLVADAEKDERLRRQYPYSAGGPYGADTVTAYTAYSGFALEDRGWRMLFPAQPTLAEAHDGLARVLRNWAPAAGKGAPRWEQAATDIEEQREGQVVLDGVVLRVARVEQLLVLTDHGPQPPLPSDRIFPQTYDERLPDDE